MITLEVHNFQSIEHEKICIDGFTALVGKSNIGKSALVRAVRAALTGATGTAFVRHGAACVKRVRATKTCECYCSVHLIGDGFDLLWEKGDKRNRYVFNGMEAGVPNRGTPEFLLRPSLEADFGMVKVGDTSKLLQIADQFDSIFLLNQTGGVTADVFADVARLDRVNVAIRFVEKDRKESVSARKVRETDIVNYGRQLLAYDSLDRDVLGVDTAEKGLDTIEDKLQHASALERYIGDLRDIGYRVEQLEDACKVSVPDPKPVKDKVRRVEEVLRLHQSASDRAAAIRRLQGVETVTVPTVEGLLETSKKHAALVNWSSKMQVMQEFFGRFRGFSELAHPEHAPVRASYDRVSQTIRLASDYEKLSRSISTLEREHAATLEEEKRLKEERETLNDFLCPTCAQPMPVTHAHERTADAELRLPN